jgi:hypothetical protein
MVQRNVTEFPAVSPVTPLLFAVGVVIVAPFAAPTMLHNPVPTAGTLPLKVNMPLLQFATSLPAFATVAGELLVKITSSEIEQAPLLIVQRNVTDVPTVNPVTALVLEAGVVIVAPLALPTILHRPEPKLGLFPAKVNDPLLQLA